MRKTKHSMNGFHVTFNYMVTPGAAYITCMLVALCTLHWSPRCHVAQV